jgi:hypothetical protein
MTTIFGAVPLFVPYKIPYITHGAMPLFDAKYELFKKFGVEVITSVSKLFDG